MANVNGSSQLIFNTMLYLETISSKKKKKGRGGGGNWLNIHFVY